MGALCMKRVTPPFPLRTAYRSILALRTAYPHFFGHEYCLPFYNKKNTTILAVSIYINKIKLQYVVRTVIAHVQ